MLGVFLLTLAVTLRSMNSVKLITSPDNTQFKHLRKIAHSARDRRKAGQTLLDGVHLLVAMADAGIKPQLIAVREGREQEAEISGCLARFPDVACLRLNARLFDAISPVEHPVGIVALMDIPRPAVGSDQCGVLLENIQDPGNLGSIMRTAAAAGANAVYLSKGCAEAWSPKVMRAAMGAHFALAIDERQDLTTLSARFETIVATRLESQRSLYDGLDLKGPVAFLFGNEGAGLSDEAAACATDIVRIPMPGEVESLNVAAAVAVCLFERVRQLT